MSSQNWGFRPDVRVLLGGKAKNIDRLLKMLPVAFCELSGTIPRFSGVPLYFIFWGSPSVFCGGSVMSLLVRTGARNNGS